MKSIVRYGMVVFGVLAVMGLLVPSAALAAEEIKIGVIYPLTGGAAAAGRELRAGAELAAEIANNVMTDISMDMAKNSDEYCKGITHMWSTSITY